MASIIPPENAAVVYSVADPQMLLRIIDGAQGPGLVSLDTLRQISAQVEANLTDRIRALESGSVSSASLTAETQARIAAMQALSKAIADEVTARSGADTAEVTARTQAISALALRVKALEDKPALRINRFTASTNASGIATFAFSPVFTTPPDVNVIEGWINGQMVSGALTAAPTISGCSAQIMVSQGTLVLNAAPFAKAGAGVSATVLALGV